MLILELKQDDKVYIGDDIIISARLSKRSNGHHVMKVAFEAPRDVVIDREKIYHKKKLERQRKKEEIAANDCSHDNKNIAV